MCLGNTVAGSYFNMEPPRSLLAESVSSCARNRRVWGGSPSVGRGIMAAEWESLVQGTSPFGDYTAWCYGGLATL